MSRTQTWVIIHLLYNEKIIFNYKNTYLSHNATVEQGENFFIFFFYYFKNLILSYNKPFKQLEDFFISRSHTWVITDLLYKEKIFLF